jgi:hypothetical protein
LLELELEPLPFDAEWSGFDHHPPTVATAATIPGSAGSTTPIPVTIDFTKMTQLTATTSATVTSQDGSRGWLRNRCVYFTQ